MGARESRIGKIAFLSFWALVLLICAVLIINDELNGPRDEVIYLWPVIVYPLGFAAVVILVTHAAAAMFSCSARVLWKGLKSLRR